MEKKIAVYGKEIEYEGKKFWGYKAETKNGTLIRSSFTQSVNIQPPKKPAFIMVIDGQSKKNNVSNAKRYPIFWVSDVIRYEDIETTNHSIDEYFD